MKNQRNKLARQKHIENVRADIKEQKKYKAKKSGKDTNVPTTKNKKQ